MVVAVAVTVAVAVVVAVAVAFVVVVALLLRAGAGRKKLTTKKGNNAVSNVENMWHPPIHEKLRVCVCV